MINILYNKNVSNNFFKRQQVLKESFIISEMNPPKKIDINQIINYVLTLISIFKKLGIDSYNKDVFLVRLEVF